MKLNLTREEIVAAMQARIDSGEMFQAKHLVAATDDLTGFSSRLNGEPISRIADKLLQKNRKGGRIWFQSGWWERIRGIP